jgi:hypothetical protein
MLVALIASSLGIQAASAQVAPVTVMQDPPFTSVDNGFGSLTGDRRTPTMKREQLARALALRDEAAELLSQDGGTLSAAHQRYIQRKACNILNPSASRTGSIAPDPSRACS